jgi:hypothetical protein
MLDFSKTWVWACGEEHDAIPINWDDLKAKGIVPSDSALTCQCGVPAVRYEDWVKAQKEK